MTASPSRAPAAPYGRLKLALVVVLAILAFPVTIAVLVAAAAGARR